MNTFGGLELREIPLSSKWAREARESFLADQGLGTEYADFAVGIYDSDDSLVGTAALSDNIITCVAVSPAYRDSSLANTLVSSVLDEAMRRGVDMPRVFTKPEYKEVFRSLGFRPVGETSNALLLEYGNKGIGSYKKYLMESREEGEKTGCIIMHCNPLTKGHLYLIEKAASQVDFLYVIPVGDEKDSMFPYAERLEMLIKATEDIKNVKVLEGSPYAVSRTTFPTYFLKKITDATDVHIGLDLSIFTSVIAPSLGVSVRFAGTEPDDALTARYNELMRAVLPQAGIEFIEIPRLISGTEAVSARRVRGLLTEGDFQDAISLTPHASWPSLLGYLASASLIKEVELTPKPGLVDSADNGAHSDMDLPLMRKSAETLRDSFRSIAALVLCGRSDAADLSAAGIEGEKRMMEATGGVNTHRGALFSLGLAVASVADLISSGSEVTPENIRTGIMGLAAGFHRPEGTHGADARSRYGIPGALDNARDGYGIVFRLLGESDPLKVLLLLMSELEDTNIYHRCGPDVAEEVRQTTSSMISSYTEEDLRKLNSEFISRRISPGGSADMLALWFFLKSVLMNKNRINIQ